MSNAVLTFLREVKFAVRSLAKSKGLSITVIVTLALGIGANAAIFSLVRGVLLRPLVNRDENRLVYIQQSARGVGMDNALFSVPEIRDLQERIKTIKKFGDFSTIGFTLNGLGEPRTVQAGVVGGTYFEVMGLHPVLGRLIDKSDDGPKAAGAVVLTYRFWAGPLNRDPKVLGKTVRLGDRVATVIGVLEPSIPYPAETEIIANVVTSPHHLSATMVTGRVHRMTELFGRLAPGATLDQARAELSTVYQGMVKQHPEAYSPKAHSSIEARLLRDQITARASTVLWVLLAASGLIFIIACANVANLILARSVRREGELAIRTALGAGSAALRRTLLAESLVLCGGGAILGVLSARPMVAILARYASRFSVRALDLQVDSSMLWVGAGLAVIASVLLAFVPKLPSADSPNGIGLASSNLRITGSTNRRLRIFAVVQIAASFVLLTGATMLFQALVSLQTAQTGVDTRHVLTLNVPIDPFSKSYEQSILLFKDIIRRVAIMPGVDGVSASSFAPWRDAGSFGPGMQFTADGHVRGPGEEDPRARFRTISPNFFASLGVPLLAGRDFNDSDGKGSEPVVIVSQSLALRMFPNGDAVNRHLKWTDPVMQFIGISPAPRRIIGVVRDIDDENIAPGPAVTVYHPMGQEMLFDGRLFVHTHGDPYALAPVVTRMIRGMAADQPVERPATLEDIRAEVLTPDRLNTVVFGGFAFVALAIAVVGVAGVLAFSVSGRTREFGIRLAVGSEPRHLVTGVLREGIVMAVAGVAAGGLCGYALAQIASSYFESVHVPGAWVIAGSAAILLTAAVVASVMPALRAARVGCNPGAPGGLTHASRNGG
jgi:predicted permease